MANNTQDNMHGENSTHDCFTDSNFVSKRKKPTISNLQIQEGEEEEERLKKEEDEDDPVESIWRTSSANEQDSGLSESTTNSVTHMDDSFDTAWTDERHCSYLNSIEASFVKQMYQKKFYVLDFCGQTSKQSESSDPDSAESRPVFPSINKMKMLQKGCWQNPHFNRAQHLGVSSPHALLSSPWIHHFIPAPEFKRCDVPSSTVRESCSKDGISAAGDLQISVLGLKHPRTKMEHEEFSKANQQHSMWHHRLGYNHGDSNGLCAKTDTRIIPAPKLPVHLVLGPDEGDQDIMREISVEKNRISQLFKKQKMKTESISCTQRDQVVSLQQSSNAADSRDSISKLNYKESSSPTWRNNNMPVSVDNKWLSENDGCSTMKNTKENTAPAIREESEIFPVKKKIY